MSELRPRTSDIQEVPTKSTDIRAGTFGEAGDYSTDTQQPLLSGVEEDHAQIGDVTTSYTDISVDSSYQPQRPDVTEQTSTVDANTRPEAERPDSTDLDNWFGEFPAVPEHKDVLSTPPETDTTANGSDDEDGSYWSQAEFPHEVDTPETSDAPSSEVPTPEAKILSGSWEQPRTSRIPGWVQDIMFMGVTRHKPEEVSLDEPATVTSLADRRAAKSLSEANQSSDADLELEDSNAEVEDPEVEDDAQALDDISRQAETKPEAAANEPDKRGPISTEEAQEKMLAMLVGDKGKIDREAWRSFHEDVVARGSAYTVGVNTDGKYHGAGPKDTAESHESEDQQLLDENEPTESYDDELFVAEAQEPAVGGGDDGGDGGDDGGDEPPEGPESSDEEPDDEHDDDHDDTPLTPDEVSYVIGELVTADLDRASVAGTMEDLLKEIERRGLQTSEIEEDDVVEGELEDEDPEQSAEYDPSEQEDIMDVDEFDEDEEEPELTPEEKERAEVWESLTYSGPNFGPNADDYPDSSIAARKLRLEAIDFEQQQIGMDNMLHPENTEANEARLEELQTEQAQIGAKNKSNKMFAKMFADERSMQFTPEQLLYLRDVAVEEVMTIDPRAAGSAARWDTLMASIDSIDSTLHNWEAVMNSDNPLMSALKLGRTALEKAIVGRSNSSEVNTEDLLRKAEALLRGQSARLPHESAQRTNASRRRVAGRRAGRGALDAADANLTPIADPRVEGSMQRRARKAQLEADLQHIQRLRARHVAGRRQAAKEAMDDESFEGPTKRIRGRGNAIKGDLRPMQSFGKPVRVTNRAPLLGARSSFQTPVRKEHRAAADTKYAAQLRVRKARARLNQHKVADRVIANVPILGAILAQQTVEAQVELQEAILARDTAARSPYLRLPAAIGKFI